MTDPTERHNLAGDARQPLSGLTSLLETQRDAKRLLPAHRNPAAGGGSPARPRSGMQDAPVLRPRR